MSEQKKKRTNDQAGPSRDAKREFCEELIAAREALKLTLADVTERTKINTQYLEKLEAGQWTFLPHTYIRSFIKTYSTMLGMDVGDVLARFDEISGVQPTPAPQFTTLEQAAEVSRRPKYESAHGGGGFARFVETARSAGLGNPLYWVAGILVVAVLVFFIYFSPRKPAREEVREIPLSEIVAEQTQAENNTPSSTTAASPESEQAPSSVTAPRSGKRVVLEAVPTDRCYIRVSADRVENVVDDVVLIRGFNRTYEADSLLIVVLGNAGGMTLRLNGERVPSLGEKGRVVTATFGPEGLRHLRRGVLNPRRQASAPPAPADQSPDSTAVGTDGTDGTNAGEETASDSVRSTDHGDPASRD